MREFRTAARSVRAASADDGQTTQPIFEAKPEEAQVSVASDASKLTDLQVVHNTEAGPTAEPALSPFQARAWRWASEQQQEKGELPSGREIAARFCRKERWGRLVKQRGQRQGTNTDLSKKSLWGMG
ncbi:hypothetical protein [Nocardiopsis synnemataformans]|uniref:hypothetical protein n=1 Tax=Nocardiopsis synnemataformans TaxID=61305 RepID=UPI003EBE5CBC